MLIKKQFQRKLVLFLMSDLLSANIWLSNYNLQLSMTSDALQLANYCIFSSRHTALLESHTNLQGIVYFQCKMADEFKYLEELYAAMVTVQ